MNLLSPSVSCLVVESAAALMVVMFAGACAGSDPSASPTAGAPGADAEALRQDPPKGDAGTPVDAQANAVDHGSPSSVYPAFTPDVPQVKSAGGALLTSPVVVTITWAGDPNAARFEAFGDAIGASSYWNALNSEYGVGPAESGPSRHVHIATAPPATISDQDLTGLIAANATSATSGWPQATSQSLYVFYLPQATALTLGGQDACQLGVGGYHDEAQANGAPVAYAVIPRCSGYTPNDMLYGASHEFDEAATDPFPSSHPAYAGFDADHLAYDFLNGFQDELGDACQNYKSSYYTTKEPAFAYPAQRQWSNRSALAAHDPCVPVPAEPYYGMTPFPQEMDAITVDLSTLMSGTAHTKGYLAKVGQPRSFEVGFYSDAATTAAWTITASVDAQLFPDATGNLVANGTATVTIDKTSGVNGEKATVTVTPTSFNALGVVFLRITSSLPGATAAQRDLPLLVGSK